MTSLTVDMSLTRARVFQTIAAEAGCHFSGAWLGDSWQQRGSSREQPALTTRSALGVIKRFSVPQETPVNGFSLTENHGVPGSSPGPATR